MKSPFSYLNIANVEKSMKINLKAIFFWIFIILMIVYFFARAWTPFWIDLCVILAALAIALLKFLNKDNK